MRIGFATVTARAPNFQPIFWTAVDVIRSKLRMAPLLIKAIGKSDEFAFVNATRAYGTAFFFVTRNIIAHAHESELVQAQ